MGVVTSKVVCMYSSSIRLATDSTIYLHTQPRVRPLPPPGGASSGHTSLSSAARTDDNDDDDDDDDEVGMINGHGEFIEVDSGLVSDLLTAADTDHHNHRCSITATPDRLYSLALSLQ